jgi:NAD(P)-dependent dehydrogenase (short-subunit alcohol dehydrogenase family)
MNKCVLITGSARRIGKGLAKGFADNGWDVIIHYNTSELEAEQLRSDLANDINYIDIVQSDLRHPSEVTKMFEELSAKPNFPDVVINNAAIFPKPKNFRSLTVEDWRNTLDSNLSSVFYVSKAFTERASKGRIINFASLGAHEVWAGRAAYHAAKSGVLHLTRAMAKDLAPEFSVNSISPGVIDIPEDQNDDKSISFEDRIPMKRFGNRKDIFDAAWFLATSSKYITGQDIKVDGGWHYSR